MDYRETIKHLGWLSRIELSEEEIDRYSKQIEEVIQYLDKLDTIPLADISPIKSVKEFKTLRQDVIREFDQDALSCAKNRKEGFVKGPRMV